MKTFSTYIKLLNCFYKDSKFHMFFDQHKALYAETKKRFDELLCAIQPEWFQSFFGKPINNPTLYISLSNGRSNYALPFFKKKNCSEYPYVEEQLRKVAYGDASSIIGEGLNELFTNMYFREYPTGWESYMIRNNENYGFIWMRRAIKFMDNFYENRNIYPHIEDFMPHIISFIRFCSENIEQIVFEYNHSNPYVIHYFPYANTTVSSEIKDIRINFSHPMHNARGIDYSKDTTAIFPVLGNEFWTNDKRSLIVPVILEKGKKYGFQLPAYLFQSEDKFPMKENVEIIFQTDIAYLSGDKKLAYEKIQQAENIGPLIEQPLCPSGYSRTKIYLWNI